MEALQNDDLSPEFLEAELVILDNLLDAEERSSWHVGDQIAKLEASPYNMDLRRIAKRYEVDGVAPKGRSYSRLSELRTIAVKVKHEQRNYSLVFNDYETLFKEAKIVERNAKKELGADYKIDIAKKIEEMRIPSASRRSIREVGKTLAAEAREALMPRRFDAAEKAIAEAPKEIINNCHHGDYVKILEALPPDSIQMLFCDPPYGHYAASKNGELNFSTSAAMSDCENDDAKGALAVTNAIFELAATRLRKNGVIVLWQAGRHLRPEIIAEAEKHGFVIGLPIVWDKVRPQAGGITTALGFSIEFAWTIHRKDEVVWNVNMLPRGQVRKWPSVQHKATKLLETHNFEKPMESNIDLMNQFTSEGDLVFDAFGCTGGMAVACIGGNRRWVYCELNKKNFKLGYSRIEKAKVNFEKPKPNDPEDTAGELVPA